MTLFGQVGAGVRAMPTRSLLGTFLLASAIGGCGEGEAGDVSGGGDGAAQDTARQAALVQVSQPDISDAVMTLTVNGDVRADRQVTLFSTVPGRIVYRPVEMGDAVRDSQRIVTVDYSQLDLAVDQARSAVTSATTMATNAADELARVERLHGAGGASKQQLDAMQTRKTTADEAVRQAKTALGRARIQRSEADVRAPFRGLIGKLFVEVGDMVGPGVPVAVLVDPDPLIGLVNIPERDLGRVAPGQPVQASVAAYPSRHFDGTVRRISPIIDRMTRMAEVEILLPNPSGLMKPGMFASVEIELDRRPDAIMVPSDVIIRESRVNAQAAGGYERTYHLYLKLDGRAVKTKVELGYTTGSMVEVLTGIASADSVIVRGQHLVHDGQATRIDSEPTGAGGEL